MLKKATLSNGIDREALGKKNNKFETGHPLLERASRFKNMKCYDICHRWPAFKRLDYICWFYSCQLNVWCKISAYYWWNIFATGCAVVESNICLSLLFATKLSSSRSNLLAKQTKCFGTAQLTTSEIAHPQMSFISNKYALARIIRKQNDFKVSQNN